RHCASVCADGISEHCAVTDSDGVPTACYYEANFDISPEDIEAGIKIPSGQIAIGNFNFRHDDVGVNFVGTGITSCDEGAGPSCFENGFLEYTLIHQGATNIRNY